MAEGASAPFDNAVMLAAVLGAHGLKGELRLKAFTESAAAVNRYGPVTAGDGRRFEILSLRAAKDDEIIASLKGIDSRDAAESLKGQRLYVPRAALPDTDEDEFYLADLVGLPAEDAKGNALGTVLAVHNFGAGDVLEIGEAGASQFVSFTRESVPKVDLGERRITVNLPEESG